MARTGRAEERAAEVGSPPLAVVTARLVDARGAVLPEAAVRLEDRFGAEPTQEVAQAIGVSGPDGGVRLVIGNLCRCADPAE